MTDAPITPPLAASARARVAIPFIIVTLIWSSTWLVIRGQLGNVPPEWSVTYRFVIAAIAIVAYARYSGATLRLTRAQQGLAIAYGIAQYGGNYFAVYLAERWVTSGLVAVLFALLVVPNAILAWIVLRQGVSRPFLMGSLIALLGLALLFGHEIHAARAPGSHVLAGIAWSLAAVLAASVANVMQGTALAKQVPVVSLVAWGMIWGVLFDAAVALVVAGPPVWTTDPLYWAGTAYLGLIGSSLAFTLYFGVIREIGPARAAYSSVLIPVLAMSLSTVFEGYRWSLLAAAGALLAMAGLVVALRAKAR